MESELIYRWACEQARFGPVPLVILPRSTPPEVVRQIGWWGSVILGDVTKPMVAYENNPLDEEKAKSLYAIEKLKEALGG